ncbi:hypothetical protein ACQZV8_16110 [Magnetococcales bacterium HHB-1]
MIDDVLLNDLLESFSEKRELYQDFMNRQIALLKEFTKENGPALFSITGEVMEADKLRKLLMDPKNKYKTLEEIDHLIKLRIILFFERGVDKIDYLIHREFKIIHSRIEDRGDHMDPDRYGYRDRSYTIELLDNRLELIEYKRFKGCKAKIQVGSLLQFVWSEIQNELGYTSKDVFPKERRREYARVAGLLEMADLEFNEIYNFIKPHKQEEMQQTLPLTQDTLINYIRTNSVVTKQDKAISDTYEKTIVEDKFYAINIYKALKSLGFEDINTLEKSLQHDQRTLLLSAHYLLREPIKGYDFLWQGISILVSAYAYAIENKKSPKLLDELNRIAIGGNRDKSKKHISTTTPSRSLERPSEEEDEPYPPIVSSNQDDEPTISNLTQPLSDSEVESGDESDIYKGLDRW